MKKLHIVRHAPVLIERDRASAEWQLGPNAAPLVQKLASEIELCSTKRIISSSQPKAVQTAEILGSEFKLEVEVREGFEEHHRENEAFVAEDLQFRAKLKTFFNRPDEPVFGSETARQALERFQSAIDALMSEGDDDELIVTHGTVSALYLATPAGDPFEIWCSLSSPDYRCVAWPKGPLGQTVLNNRNPSRGNTGF